MTAPTNFNLDTLRGRAFQGFVQFQIPTNAYSPNGNGTWLRLKEKQSMSLKMQFNRAEHYSDDGTKLVDPSGHNHSFSMEIKLTTDMVDNVFSESSDPETMSYWIYRNTINQPIQIIFVTTFGMISGPTGFTSNDTVNLKFILDPSGFSFGQSAGGSPNVTISGTVLNVAKAIRADNEDQLTTAGGGLT
jgi:hypothetical protein